MRDKYISPEDANNAEVVYISGKHAEEVGLEKLAKRQALLQGIRSLVLDRMCIRHRIGDDEASQTIPMLCAEITSLDLRGNLFVQWEEVLDLAKLFPKLRSLVLDGNRISLPMGDAVEQYSVQLAGIRELSLSETLIRPSEVASAITAIPSLEVLTLANNEISVWDRQDLPPSVRVLDLSGNRFESFTALRALAGLPQLGTLLLKGNSVGANTTNQHKPDDTHFDMVSELELRDNKIASWSFFNTLPAIFPAMKHIRIAGNPLYRDLKSAEGKALSTDDGYMLTIARLPQLELLNYSKITDKERLNAETYYLGQIAIGLSNANEQQREVVLAGNPRYQALCEEYGEPTISTKPKVNEVDLNSLAARLVNITFIPYSSKLQPCSEWTEEVPKSLNTYALLGIVGKRISVMPLKLRLVWETGERDPVRDEGSEAPEWWDSSDEDTDAEGGEWTAREVELVPGTRPLGTYMEGRTARVRVEMVSER